MSPLITPATTSRQIVPGSISALRVTAYPYQSAAIDLDDVVISVEISDQADKCAVEARIDLANVDGVAKLITPGTWLTIQGKSPISNDWIWIAPYMYVWERGVTDARQGVSQVVALDPVSFLQRQGQQSYFFRRTKKRKAGWRASDIANAILRDLGVPSNVSTTPFRINWFLLQDVTPYEAIVKALTRDKQMTGVSYRMRAGRAAKQPQGGIIDPEVVFVEPVTTQDHTWELTDDTTIISASRTESLEGLATEYIGVVLNKDGKELKRVKVTGNGTARYGTLRRFEVLPKGTKAGDARKAARNELFKMRDLKREATIQSLGITTLRASDMVRIEDGGTGLSGFYWVSSITHKIAANGHTMDVDLSYTSVFPEVEVDESEYSPSKTSTGGASGAKGEQAVAWAATQAGVPYVYGGTQPKTATSRGGLDCSSLTMLAWRSVGVNIPRVTYSQATIGEQVRSLDDAAPGDLVFWNGDGGRDLGHVAIYSGGGKAWSAPYTGTVVQEITLNRGKIQRIVRPIPLSQQGEGSGGSTGGSSDKVAAVGEEWQYASGQFSGGGQSGGAGSGAGADDLKKRLKKRGAPDEIASLAETFVTVCEGAGVNPIFLAAVMCAETGNGRDSAARSSKNILGLFGGPGSKSYPSYEACIKDAVSPRFLRGPVYNGKDTISAIGAEWAKPGASNDGGGNAGWPRLVKSIFRDLGGGDPEQKVK